MSRPGRGREGQLVLSAQTPVGDTAATPCGESASRLLLLILFSSLISVPAMREVYRSQ